MRNSLSDIKMRLGAGVRALMLVAGVMSVQIGMEPQRAYAMSVESVTTADLVHDAAMILSGKVIGQRSRYGDASRRWLVTDYTVQTEDVLVSENGQRADREVVLSYWGGTLDNQTQHIAGLVLPRLGERYIFFIRKVVDQSVGVPTVGGNQGLLRIAHADPKGEETLLDEAGHPMSVTAALGSVLPSIESISPSETARPVSAKDFVQVLRANATRLRAAEKRPRAVARETERMPIYARPDTLLSALRPLRPSTRRPVAPASDADPMRWNQHSSEQSAAISGREGGKREGNLGLPLFPPEVNGFVPSGSANLPIVISQFPSSWSTSPEDQYQMSHWNYYGSDVFHVYAAPPTDWAWKNDVFDLAGWPTDDVMMRQFGTTWAGIGAGTLAVTFIRRNSSNVIIEADVAFNPGEVWTLDDEAVYDSSTMRGFRRSMTHELGHVLGLEHQFDYLSIMNYPASQFRGISLPYMDDAGGIRGIYPSRRVEVTDLGIHLFYSAGYQDWKDATFPSSARAGSSITVSRFQLENAGTRSVSAPAVEWYLCSNRDLSGSYYYLGAVSFAPALDPFHYYTPATISATLRVPATVPAGSYYLAAFIRGDSGPATNGFQRDNNRSFSHSRIAITR